jgi:hypothetical protein
MAETENENATNYTAISYGHLKRDFRVTEMEDEKADLYSILMLIRAFRRSSVSSEN